MPSFKPWDSFIKGLCVRRKSHLLHHGGGFVCVKKTFASEDKKYSCLNKTFWSSLYVCAMRALPNDTPDKSRQTPDKSRQVPTNSRQVPTSPDKLPTTPDNSRQLPTNSERSLKSGISLDGIATLLCKFSAGVSHSRDFLRSVPVSQGRCHANNTQHKNLSS